MARALLVFVLTFAVRPAGAQESDVIRRGIPAEALDRVAGCWETDGERWTIERERGGRASVLRVVEGPRGERMGRRARLRSELMYRPSEDRFAFGAAGRIHALLILFTAEHDRLQAHPFRRRPGHPPRWTGSTVELTPCAEP